MAFRFFEDLRKKNEEGWRSHLNPEIMRRLENPSPITRAEFDSMRMNTYTRMEVLPRLDLAAFIENVEFCLSNCSRIPTQYGRECPITYDDSIKILAKEAVKRLKQFSKDHD